MSTCATSSMTCRSLLVLVDLQKTEDRGCRRLKTEDRGCRRLKTEAAGDWRQRLQETEDRGCRDWRQATGDWRQRLQETEDQSWVCKMQKQKEALTLSDTHCCRALRLLHLSSDLHWLWCVVICCTCQVTLIGCDVWWFAAPVKWPALAVMWFAGHLAVGLFSSSAPRCQGLATNSLSTW